MMNLNGLENELYYKGFHTKASIITEIVLKYTTKGEVSIKELNKHLAKSRWSGKACQKPV